MSEKRALLKEESIPALRVQIKELSGQRVNQEVESKCIGLPKSNCKKKWHIEVFNANAKSDSTSQLLSLLPNRESGHVSDNGDSKHEGEGRIILQHNLI